MVHHEFTTFSQKDYISHFGNAWETLDYKARRSSSTVAISGCHSANLWIGKKMLQMVLQIVFFFGYFKPKNYNLCVIFCTRKTCFLHFLMQHPQHMFCLFLRAPNLVFFRHFFVHQIVLCLPLFLSYDVFCLRFLLCTISCFSAILSAPFFCLKSCYCNMVSKIRIPILSAH